MSELEPVVRIGEWQYQVIYGQLSQIDQPTDAMIRLEPLLHSLLNYFLLQPNVVLTKDMLLDNVWPADAGSDAAVMRAVGALRKVLGDDVRAPRYIATIPKKGYRWLAEISPSSLISIAQQSALSEQNVALHLADTAKANLAPGNTANSTEISSYSKRQTDHVWSWRFVIISTLVLLVGSAGFAFILSLYTTQPLLKLPDTITPISALNGQEYWPILNTEQTQVIYQHRQLGETSLGWVQQDLQSRRAHFLPQQYLALSAAQWLDNQHIVFSGQTNQLACAIFQQQLYPKVADAELLWRCNQLQAQGLIKWQQQWLWLDTLESNDADNNNKRLELWSGQQQQPAQRLASYAFIWHSVSAMLIQQDTLYLLAHETANNTVLLTVDLNTTTLSLLQRFNRKINDMAWWDDTTLLLSSFNQNLIVYDFKAKSEQDLGPLTRPLAQASRYPGQVLATQYLNYTSDIYQVALAKDSTRQLTPWQMSNRSEYLLADNGEMQAYISERSGVSQVWLQNLSGQSIQLTNFTRQQPIQQLFWHKQQLMLVVDSQLNAIDIATGELTLAKQQANSQSLGRYASCQQQLVWTALTDGDWQLFMATEQGTQALYSDVADVRCGREQQLIIQHAATGQLSVLALKNQQAQLIQSLPITIDWRQVTSEQWFVDESGIYWLNPNKQILQSFLWQDQQMRDHTWFQPAWPLAIYSNGNGLGYIVQPRPFDTDIVWLQHRR
ncbi:winged helix-turn-helix domain-containing protein [Rheinheimera salexigens]|uniref:OmpR/PhoB-type domain-containing protein n=1 Tax=Rheinheimera salexigens TaxID=1628148 RepID=A0A1E7Q4J5_9GAMM|nr:winged helix-turn-helix domain-containing protein [Rheinheimera salexigens]OEY69057.1 hypothetical protein BI198_05330 [Rheinheimera salexigens]